MAFGADDVQASLGRHSLAEDDVRPPPRHIGGDGDRTLLPGPFDDFRFPLVVFGVQHLVGNAAGLEHGAQALRFFDGDGAHQNRLPSPITAFNLIDHGAELASFGLVDHIRMIHPDHRLIGGNDHHIHAVNPAKLLLFRLGCTGHTGQLLVHAEVVLEGDRSEGLAFPFHPHPFFGFDGLMEAVGVPSAGHQPAGELIDDDDLPFFDHVVPVPLEQGVGPEGLLNVMG